MYRLIFLFLFLSNAVVAQSLTEAQQKALLQYMDLANRSAEGVTSIGSSLKSIYEDVQLYKSDKHRRMRFYTCPSQFDETSVQITSTVLGAESANLNTKAKTLTETWKKL